MSKSLQRTSSTMNEFMSLLTKSTWKYSGYPEGLGELRSDGVSDERIQREQLVAATAFNSKALRRLVGVCHLSCFMPYLCVIDGGL